MVPPDSTNFISDAISMYGSKKYQNGHLCVSGLKLLATTVKQHFESEVPTVEIGFMHDCLLSTSSESMIRHVGGIVSYLLHVPTEPGIF